MTSVNISKLAAAGTPQDNQPISVSIKLNNDILRHLKSCLSRGVKPKLIVKNGHISVKISENEIFPCTQIVENLKVDIYSRSRYEGRVSTRLNVITDSRHIKDLEKAATNSKKDPIKKVSSSTSLSKLVNSISRSPINVNPYLVSANDSKPEMLNKVLSFIALGPTTRDKVLQFTNISHPEFSTWISIYTQPYNHNDTFIIDDVFPNINSVPADAVDHFILKDKSYKDLRPWEWPYSGNERTLIINNIQNALTRLGFSETHPLRDKICNMPVDEEDKDKRPLKKSTLGGGILVSKKPFKKSQTESPKLTGSKLAESPNKVALSNSKLSGKRKFSSSSSSEEDDEKHNTKKNKTDSYTSPSSINEEENTSGESNTEDSVTNKSNSIRISSPAGSTNAASSNTKRLEYYNNLAEKFRSKYVEYKSLYNALKTNPKRNDKKNLVKLFELHNCLSEWKRKLWDFDSESKLKSNIMNLSKHKKQASTTPSSTIVKASTPVIAHTVFTKSIPSSASSLKSQSLSPAIKPTKDNVSTSNFSNFRQNKPKMTLDY